MSGEFCVCKSITLRPLLRRANRRNPHIHNHQTCHQPLIAKSSSFFLVSPFRHRAWRPFVVGGRVGCGGENVCRTNLEVCSKWSWSRSWFYSCKFLLGKPKYNTGCKLCLLESCSVNCSNVWHERNEEGGKTLFSLWLIQFHPRRNASWDSAAKADIDFLSSGCWNFDEFLRFCQPKALLEFVNVVLACNMRTAAAAADFSNQVET